MVDYRDTSEGITVDRVQLSDLEDSTHIPPGQALRGLKVGNQFWRSPEAHVQGAVGKPSDIFSLALVVSLTAFAYVSRLLMLVPIVHIHASQNGYLPDRQRAKCRSYQRHPRAANIHFCRVE